MTRILRFVTAGALVALALCVGCGTAPPSDDSQPVELKTYSVPIGYENEVRSMLRNALMRGEEPIGRVEMGPAGKLLVVAPASIHRGVETFIQELHSLDSPPPAPLPVTMTYWVLAGRPMGRTAPPTRMKVHAHDGFSVIGQELPDVLPALEQIARSQGPTEFTLLERLQLSSTGDERGEVTGKFTELSQRAMTVQDSIVAELVLRVHGYSLRTQVKLRPEQLVVLGQTGYGGEEIPWLRTDSEGLKLYYVIASDLE